MVLRRHKKAVLALLFGAVLGGCGGGGGTTATTGAGAAGAPGDPAKATRTIDVRAGDDLRFQPDAVSAKVGETITFNVPNGGKLEHEFTLGDAAAQTQHEKEMKSTSGGQMSMAQPNSVDVPAGATKQLTWTFTAPGSTLYGCHEPGHYAAGMKGTVTVT